MNEIVLKIIAILPYVLAINVVLAAVGSALGMIGQSSASKLISSISGWLKKIVDMLSANLPH